MIKLKF